jgi:hypothetical protein
MPPPWVSSVNFLTAVLPSISAWSMAMISVFEFKRRATLYQELIKELQILRAKMASANCASAVASVMHQTERFLLTELWEWKGFINK